MVNTGKIQFLDEIWEQILGLTGAAYQHCNNFSELHVRVR